MNKKGEYICFCITYQRAEGEERDILQETFLIYV